MAAASLRAAAAWDSCGTGSWWLQTVHSSTSAHKALTELQYTCSQWRRGVRRVKRKPSPVLTSVLLL